MKLKELLSIIENSTVIDLTKHLESPHCKTLGKFKIGDSYRKVDKVVKDNLEDEIDSVQVVYDNILQVFLKKTGKPY
jgi:hypothetical protein